MPIDFFRSTAPEPFAHILLAHGAMAPMDSPFLETISKELSARGLCVHRFEFSYMAGRRTGGKKRPPPRAENLVEEYHAAIDQVILGDTNARPLIIGGKSLGGRVASMIADDAFAAGKISGVVCLGYPFHPPKKPDQLRTAHLECLTCPALILQGERDPFGTPAEIESYAIDPKVCLHWIGDGDHDFGPRGRSGFTKRGNMEAAAEAIREFSVSLQKQM